MDPLTMLTLAQGVVGLGQTIGGALSGAKRPEYELPPALRESLALARINVANPYSPGYRQAKAQSDLTMANQIAAAQQQGNPQESIQTIAAGQQKTQRELEMYNEQDQKQDVSNLQGELGKLQQAQDLMFQMNQFAPYADKSQQSKNMIGAGLENMFAAGDQYAQMSMMKDLYGLNAKNTPSGVSQSAPNNQYPMSYEEAIQLMNQMKISASPTISSKPMGLVKKPR